MNHTSASSGAGFWGINSRGRQYAVAVVAACAGVWLSFFAFSQIRDRERERLRRDFEQVVQDRVAAVKGTIEIDSLIVRSVGAFYAGSNEVDRREFQVFASPLLTSRLSLSALEWVPRVPQSERARFVAAARKDGYPDFEITEYDAQGSSVPAARREEYFPVFYREQDERGAAPLGFDLATDPQCREAMQRACDAGRLTATPKVLLDREPADRFGLRLFLPIYRKDSPLETLEDRRSGLQGFVVALLPACGILEDGVSAWPTAGVDVWLFDGSSASDRKLLHYHSSRARGTHAASADPASIDPPRGLVRRSTLDVADRKCTILFAPTPEFIAARATWHPWAGLLACLTVTALAVMYPLANAAHSVRTERLICRLTEANRQWEKESADRQRAERNLLDSQVRYKTLYDLSSDPIMLATPEEGFLSGNRAAVALFGCKDEKEFTSCSPACLSPERQPDGAPSAAKAQQMMAIAMERGSHFFEWTHKRMDGAEFPATVLLTRMELGGKAVLQATVRDVTQQKRADEAVQRESAKLAAMISGMEEGVVFADADNAIVEVNDYLCRFVGKQRGEILRKRIEDFHPHGPLERVLGQIDRFRREIGSGPFVLQRPLGGKEVILRMQPIYRDGRYEGVLLNVIDVSELVQARCQAEAANRAKSGFLARMSHEIRTPMTAILGYTDLLTDSALSASDRANYLAVVRRNGEHLLSLINDILDLSKIEAGKFSIETTRCSLVSLLADVASMMRPRAEERRNSLSVEYTGPIPETILTDGTRLRQAVGNLVGNAVKFTENGQVRIVVSFLSDAEGGRPAVRIAVVDTGIGISEERLPDLFQPFVQADVSISRKFGGTGLGLAISRNIAGLLGGDLTVESALGRGSTFTLTVPTGDLRGIRMLNRPAEAIKEAPADAAAASTRELAGVRVLLAEDGPDNQDLIRTVLRKAGAEVEVAENGRVAVSRVLDHAQPFDVILMDVNMPEMDGYEATRLLRARGCVWPILALTANAMSSDVQRSLDAGCNDHLAKPIDRLRLIHAVARYARKERTDSPPSPPPTDAAPEGQRSVLVSEFAADPDMAAILDGFIARLDGHVQAMQSALDGARFEELQRLAHQLKGSGGSYGYPSLTDAARELESAVKARDAGAMAPLLDRIALLSLAIQEARCVGTSDLGPGHVSPPGV